MSNQAPEQFDQIGAIGNYYGGLMIRRDEDGKCFWGIEDVYSTLWEEIPSSLYDALRLFHLTR